MKDKTILVIGAHPDDETLMAGGLIARAVREGGTVYVVCATRNEGYGSIKDLLRATSTLGVTEFNTHTLNYADQGMHLIDFNEVVKAITRVIGIAKPDIVVTHWHGDLNKDHVILNEAVKVATRPKGDSIVPAVWEGFVSSSSDWGYTGAFDPRIFVTLTKEDLTAKLEAMACYGTECIGLRAPEALEAIARYTGAQVGTLYAEPFALVRSVL